MRIWPASTPPAPSAQHWGRGPTSSTAWCRPPSSLPAVGGYLLTTAATSPASPPAPRTCTAPRSTRPSPVAGDSPHGRGPLPRRQSRPGHRRPAWFLARILAGGAQGDGGPLPQTRLARGPLHRPAPESGAAPALSRRVRIRCARSCRPATPRLAPMASYRSDREHEQRWRDSGFSTHRATDTSSRLTPRRHSARPDDRWTISRTNVSRIRLLRTSDSETRRSHPRPPPRCLRGCGRARRLRRP